MKVTKIKKVYSYELQSKLKETLGTQELDYRIRRVIEDLCDDGLYIYDYSKTKSKLRITFPFFILVVLLANVFSAVKWLFTGSARFSQKSWFVKTMVKWDRYCVFNIV